MNTMNLRARRVLVTGTSRGIGLAIARRGSLFSSPTGMTERNDCLKNR